MHLVKVDTIPKQTTHTQKKDIKNFIKEFINMNTKYAKVLYGEQEYAHIETARSAMKQACDRYKYPVIVTRREGEVYLVRTDL